jgi:hypothetical protein
MRNRFIPVVLAVLMGCAATSESETRRWSNNQQDAGRAQTNYPGAKLAIEKLLADATIKFNEANTKSGNAQLQDMQQANKVIEQILYPIRDYERELQEAQSLISQVPTAAPTISAAMANAKNSMAMFSNPDPNIAIGAFKGAYEQLKPINDWAEAVKAGKNPPMPTIPGMTVTPGMPGVAPGVGAPGMDTPGMGTPGMGAPTIGTPGINTVPGMGTPTNGGPGENPGAVPGAPGAPGGEVPGAIPGTVPPAGGPGGN